MSPCGRTSAEEGWTTRDDFSLGAVDAMEEARLPGCSIREAELAPELDQLSTDCSRTACASRVSLAFPFTPALELPVALRASAF